MNKDNAKEFLPLVEALADGRTIQVCQYNGDGTFNKEVWIDRLFGEVSFDLPCECYRIKPEPLEFWINVYFTGRRSIPYETIEEATSHAGSDRIDVIHVREVI